MPQPWEDTYERPKTLTQYGEDFGPNLLSSAGKFASDIGHAIMHPIDTTTGLVKTVAGGIEKMAPLPERGPHEQYAEAFGKVLSDRYGGVDKFAKTLYEDPVGTLSDVSLLAGGAAGLVKGAAAIPRAAGMARTAGALEKGAQIAETVANVTDPVRIGFNAATLPLRPFGIPERIYQSSFKPPPGSYSSEEVKGMIRTGLEERVPVSEKGVNKLWSNIEDLNTKVKDFTDAATQRGVAVSPVDVAKRVDDIEPIFREQVNPNKSLKQLAKAKQEFLEAHQTEAPFTQVLPSLDPGGGYFPVGTGSTPVPTPIPADVAQRIKVGTYRQIKKSYGELKNAQVEAQKALARGIKEELADAIPEIGALNERESNLLQLVPAIERAVRREGGHQLFGIGTPIAAGAVGAATGDAKLAAVAGTLRAVLDDPWVKSRLAIAIHHAQKTRPGKFGPARMTTATARVDDYLQQLEKMIAEKEPVPATVAP